MSEIKLLQTDEDFYEEQGDKYCLVHFTGQELTYADVENQSNFCILQIINAYKKGLLSSKEANELINKIDLFNYSMDMLGPKQTIEKINREIIEKDLHMPYFNSLCILCEDLYDSY